MLGINSYFYRRLRELNGESLPCCSLELECEDSKRGLNRRLSLWPLILERFAFPTSGEEGRSGTVRIHEIDFSLPFCKRPTWLRGRRGREVGGFVRPTRSGSRIDSYTKIVKAFKRKCW